MDPGAAVALPLKFPFPDSTFPFSALNFPFLDQNSFFFSPKFSISVPNVTFLPQILLF